MGTKGFKEKYQAQEHKQASYPPTVATQTFTLNTGAKIPAVGLGTWQSPPGEVAKAVEHALRTGYRHLDCAFVYGNESEVGLGIRRALETGICKCEDIFVTSKLWCTYHRRAEECLDEGLKRLGLEYVDLYLMHWPVPMNPQGNHPLQLKLEDGSRDLDTEWSHVQTWKEMEGLVKSGKTKAIGVSNYSVKFLEELLPQCEVVPSVSQVENHPYLPQGELSEFCRGRGNLIEAYSPLGSTGSPLFEEEGVKEVARKHGVGEGTVLISYQVARGHVVLPKSVTPSRIEDNLKIVKLDSADVDLGFPDKQ
ncbi:hypothetical protein LTR62_004441 [Meristemomyces frigidus]|uniref:NADP-dependent oxidoreductase domain-containing protein n=1 Tax=Meristemomyces frigidus TaxID=1508187 RepID=A0AAN7YG20_9PEZI|nr:hypothetical protein LTR62_004441 [Meristemomyces frigidus]